MAKAIALTHSAIRQAADPLELLRAAIVLGCGAALILAGPAFPF